jgi:hypothetical protein
VLVPNSATVLRRIKRKDILKLGGIRKAAFLPAASGKDEEGLSVSIARPELISLHRTRYEAEKSCAAFLIVETIRALAVNEIALQVTWAPITDDPAHSLIVGIPGRGNLPQEERKRAERYADLLAQAARSYVFPEA